MPLEGMESHGSNADASKNMDYCRHCFKDGEFTLSNVPAGQQELVVDGTDAKNSKGNQYPSILNIGLYLVSNLT